MIIVIGRGHSGTRAIAQTLADSGVWMGKPLNNMYDLCPPGPMYSAGAMAGEYVDWLGTEWDFTRLLETDPPQPYMDKVAEYLVTVLVKDEPVGWKLPQTLLGYPWLVKLFPYAHYIHWIRDPRDALLGPTAAFDDLRRWNIPLPDKIDGKERRPQRRVLSWKYCVDLVMATPQPERFIEVRFEDFVLKQAETLDRLSTFLHMELVEIPVQTQPVGRHEVLDNPNLDLTPILPEMALYGYE
jgi:hypothetical protein